MIKFFKNLFKRKESDIPKEDIYFLVKYRDSEMDSYLYFWVKNNEAIGPSFNTPLEAQNWIKQHSNNKYGVDINDHI